METSSLLDDRDVARCMNNHGGSFVSKLGAAALAADPVNLKTIRDAFPAYWASYHKMAIQLLEVEKQATP